MLTVLEVKKHITALESEAEDYKKTKLALQKEFPKAQIAKQVKVLDAKYKKCADRVADARHIISILESMKPEAMEADRNGLLIRLRAIQDREPMNEEDQDTGPRPYTTEELKNPEVKKKIKAHYDMYKYDKLRKQYRSLSAILRP